MTHFANAEKVRHAARRLVFILDNIRSRHNVGSIFRTADGVGAEKIYLCGITPIPPHADITKTALGAEKCVAWEKSWELGVIMHELRQEGYVIIGAEKTETSVSIEKYNWPNKVALLFGPEVEGNHAGVLALCDAVVHIPMHGTKTSLNVSVAAGVLAYAGGFSRKIEKPDL